MDARILAALLTQKINPSKYQSGGIDLGWQEDELYNTPESKKIINEAISNYKTLEAEYLSEKEKQEFNGKIIAQLDALDKKRIRPLAEGDTEYLKGLNEQIIKLRETLRR